MAGSAHMTVFRGKEPHRKGGFLPAGVSADDVERQLRRILSSPLFQSSRRLSDFLRYVVTLTLEGKAGQITQQSLAVQVLGRHDYDAVADSAIRVAAGRLRAKLREYYQSDGVNDSIAIGLPKSRYIPSFAKVTGHRHPVSDHAFRL